MGLTHCWRHTIVVSSISCLSRLSASLPAARTISPSLLPERFHQSPLYYSLKGPPGRTHSSHAVLPLGSCGRGGLLLIAQSGCSIEILSSILLLSVPGAQPSRLKA